MSQTSSPLKSRSVSGAKPGRITSLDAVRGVFLCVSISSVSVLSPRPEFLTHARWIGVHFEDLIFPLFVILSGCGLAFAYRNQVSWSATLRRSLVLLICGLAFGMIEAQDYGFSELHWTGPLQVYAVLVLVIGLLHMVVKRARGWMLVTLGLAGAQAVFLYLWQSGCPEDLLTPGCNPSNVIDRSWMGTPHMYHQGIYGHDPEGVVSMLGALVTASAGAAAGHLALSSRGSWRAPAKLLGWAAAMALSASLVAPHLPAMKRLWTTPFALGVGSLGIVALAVGMSLLDLPAPRAWDKIRKLLSWPFVALGRNSLFVYFGSHILVVVMLQTGGKPSNAVQFAQRLDFLAGHPRTSFVAIMLAFWVTLAAVLHRRKLYIRP